MTLVRWDPFRELEDMSDRLNRMCNRPALPRINGKETMVVADGTSCRHQIHDGSGREALHVARVLQMALKK